MAAIIVDKEKCVGCGVCVDVCSAGAINMEDDVAHISEDCTLCGICIDECPSEAIKKTGANEDLDNIDIKHLENCRDIWVIAEVRGNSLTGSSFELLGEATRLVEGKDHQVAAVLLCSDAKDYPQQLIAHGADKVYLVKNEALRFFRDEPYTHIISELIKDYQPLAVLFGATSVGRSLAPRLAARLHTGLSADCTTLELRDNGILIQTRPAFGGNLFASILCPYTHPQMATVRPKVMQPLTADGKRQGQVIEKPFDLTGLKIRTQVLDFVEQVNQIAVDEADIVVAAGYGVGSLEGLALVKELADAYGAALGVTRKLVDEGWISYEHQIGQTGKTIGPKLYIACGISGAVQHIVGISSSKTIVAINHDPDAVIFRIADFGIEGDLHEIIPLLIERKEAFRKKITG